MQTKIATITEELQLLGWSEEGAKNYAKNFTQETKIGFSQMETEYFIIAIILIFLGCLFFIIYRYRKDNFNFANNFSKDIIREENTQKYLNLEIEKKTNEERMRNIKQANYRKNNIFNTFNKQEFRTDLLIKLFKDTSINIDSLIEHILLISLVSIESLIKLITYINIQRIFLYKSSDSLSVKTYLNQSIESISINNDKIIEKRKNELKKKTKLELKNLLKNIPKISQLNKSQLVEKILEIELN